jgi:hypothetical protein
VYALSDSTRDPSLLPGVPRAHLEHRGIRVEPAIISGWAVTPVEASQSAAGAVCGASADDATQVLPVHLTSRSHPVFDGAAWAVLLDTSEGYEWPPFCGPGWEGVLFRSDDYYAVFIDAQTGEFLLLLSEKGF